MKFNTYKIFSRYSLNNTIPVLILIIALFITWLDMGCKENKKFEPLEGIPLIEFPAEPEDFTSEFIPRFEFTHVKNASYYEIYINNFKVGKTSETTFYPESSVSLCDFTFPAMWYVRACNNFECKVSDHAAIPFPLPPPDFSPSTFACLNEPLVIEWEGVEDATEYMLRYGSSCTIPMDEFTTIRTTQTKEEVVFAKEGHYCMQLAWLKDSCQSAWSEPIDVLCGELPHVKFRSPRYYATTSMTAQEDPFSWEPTFDYSAQYEIQIASSPDFQEIVYTTTTETYIDKPCLSPGIYSMRIRAFSDGCIAEWSEISEYEIESVRPVIQGPTEQCPNMPFVLFWNYGRCAATYELQWHYGDGFSSPDVETLIIDQDFKNFDLGLPEGTVSFRVKAILDWGETSFSDIFVVPFKADTKSWTHTTLEPEAYTDHGSVAFDSKLNIHLAIQGIRDCLLRHVWSTDNGASWTMENSSIIDDTRFTKWAVKLLVSSDDGLHILYTRIEESVPLLIYKRTYDNGKTYDMDTTLLDFTSLLDGSQRYNAPEIDVIIDQEDTIHLAFVFDNSLYYMYGNELGEHWSEPIYIRNTKEYKFVTIANSPSGDLHIAASEEKVVGYIRSSNGGKTWSENTYRTFPIEHSENNTQALDMIVGPNYIHLIYLDLELYYTRSGDNGETWETVHTIDDLETPGLYDYPVGGINAALCQHPISHQLSYFFHLERFGGSLAVLFSEDYGDSWRMDLIDSVRPGTGYALNATIDPEFNLHVRYFSRNGHLYKYARYGVCP